MGSVLRVMRDGGYSPSPGSKVGHEEVLGVLGNT